MRARLALLSLVLTACGTTVPSATQQASIANPQEQQQPQQTGQAPASVDAAPETADASPTQPDAPGAEPAPTSTEQAPTESATAAEQHGSGPIKVGIVSTNNDAAASAGIDNGNTFTTRTVFEALVKAYNKRGGIAGRTIVPTYAEVKSSSSDLAKDLQAVCAQLTQDAKVAVVLAEVGAYFESFESCLTKAGTPLVSGDYALGDDQALAKDPGYLSATTLTTDRRMRTLLTQMVKAKRLTNKDKLGVIVEGCPYNERTYANTVVPVAKQLGVPVADHVVSRCFGNAADLGGLASEMTNAVLRFRNAGINHVTFISGGVEGNVFLVFAAAAQSQSYYPRYSLTSAAAPTVQEANTPPRQLANAAGLGWLPSIDTTQAMPMTRPQKACLADLKSQGLAPATTTDRFFSYSTCDTLGLYAAALTAASGVSSRSALVAAAQRLGTSFQGAATYGGATDFSSGRRAAVAQGRLFAWSTGCTCFAYTGTPFPL